MLRVSHKSAGALGRYWDVPNPVPAAAETTARSCDATYLRSQKAQGLLGRSSPSLRHRFRTVSRPCSFCCQSRRMLLGRPVSATAARTWFQSWTNHRTLQTFPDTVPGKFPDIVSAAARGFGMFPEPHDNLGMIPDPIPWTIPDPASRAQSPQPCRVNWDTRPLP